MQVFYIHCNSCGYEDFDVKVGYSRTVASGSRWVCPLCNQEVSDVDIDEP